MVRGKALSCNTRAFIVKEHNMGKPYKQIARELCLPRSTVHSVIKKFEMTGQVNVRKKIPFVSIPTVNLQIENPVKNILEPHIQNGDNPFASCLQTLQSMDFQICNVMPPFQSIREPEVNIYAEEEKMTPRPDSSLLEEQSFTLDSVQENGVDTFHEPKVRHKKSKKIGSKRKLKKSSTIQATLDSLKTVTKAISAQHDEFSLFGEYMAMSLRTMPMRNALKCKEKLLSVIVNERLSLNSETS